MAQGKQELKTKKYKEAIKTFEKVMRYQPENKKAEEYMMYAQKKRDAQKKGRKNGSVKKRKTRKSSVKKKKLTTGQKAANKKRADSLYQKGLESYTAGDKKNAVKLWKKVLTIDPAHTKTLNALRRNGKL